MSWSKRSPGAAAMARASCGGENMVRARAGRAPRISLPAPFMRRMGRLSSGCGIRLSSGGRVVYRDCAARAPLSRPPDACRNCAAKDVLRFGARRRGTHQDMDEEPGLIDSLRRHWRALAIFALLSRRRQLSPSAGFPPAATSRRRKKPPRRPGGARRRQAGCGKARGRAARRARRLGRGRSARRSWSTPARRRC